MKDLTLDFDSLLSNPHAPAEPTRRAFMATTLGTGFAAAVLPTLSHAAIVTDSDGLEAGTVTVMVGDHPMPVYRAQPKAKQNLPVVLVVSEIFGVHQHIADVARRFAQRGYLALAPDLFGRQGDPTAYTSIPDLLKNLIAKVPDEQVMQDLDACVAWAYRNTGDTQRLGITGFCWGGRITWLYAAHNPQVKAGVAWYGRLVGEKNTLQPGYPVDVAPSLKVPVLGLYGGRDEGIPLASVESMRAALGKGRSGSEIIVYPEAGHAFHADYRPSYLPEAAQDGWKRCLGWFERHGV
jgi:carboxymethylenebutenolidase